MTDRILTSFELPDAEGTVVLYDYMQAGMEDGRNLTLFRDGQLQWQATPPHPAPDCFVSAHMENGTLTAHTWSGYKVSIAMGDGSITNREFTK